MGGWVGGWVGRYQCVEPALVALLGVAGWEEGGDFLGGWVGGWVGGET